MSILNLSRSITLRGAKSYCELFVADLEEIAFAYATDTAELGIYTNGAWVWIGGGAGDMTKAVYDADDDGTVDDSEALEGHAASYFATAGHSHTAGQYRAMAWMEDGLGGWEFATISGLPTFTLENLE